MDAGPIWISNTDKNQLMILQTCPLQGYDSPAVSNQQQTLLSIYRQAWSTIWMDFVSVTICNGCWKYVVIKRNSSQFASEFSRSMVYLDMSLLETIFSCDPEHCSIRVLESTSGFNMSYIPVVFRLSHGCNWHCHWLPEFLKVIMSQEVPRRQNLKNENVIITLHWKMYFNRDFLSSQIP